MVQPSVFHVAGDLHGQAEPFEAVLHQVGFRLKRRVWTPPSPHEQLLTNGDLIERGPYTPRTVKTLRDMQKKGFAIAHMGNHEKDAQSWEPILRGHYKIKDSGFSEKRVQIFLETAAQYRKEYGGSDAYRMMLDDIDYFTTMPYFGAYGGLRVAHASWIARNIGLLGDFQALANPSALDVAKLEARHQTSLHVAIRETLYGVALDLKGLMDFDPGLTVEDVTYLDPRGVPRTHARLRPWVQNAENITKFSDFLFVPGHFLKKYVEKHPQIARIFAENHLLGDDGDKRPLLLGHYYRPGRPEIKNPKIASIDFADHVCLYTYHAGETELKSSQLSCVKF